MEKVAPFAILKVSVAPLPVILNPPVSKVPAVRVSAVPEAPIVITLPVRVNVGVPDAGASEML
jgi:hypothetical protein